ncbi:MAG: hypothetical protein ABL953_05255 [Ilumatobacteraceae bacterium]
MRKSCGVGQVAFGTNGAAPASSIRAHWRIAGGRDVMFGRGMYGSFGFLKRINHELCAGHSASGRRYNDPGHDLNGGDNDNDR